MAGRNTGYHYAGLAMRASAMEHELNALLEEFVTRLSDAPNPHEVDKAATELALASSRLAHELHAAHPEAAAERTEFMDELDARASHLQRLLPEAILAGEQDHWSAQLESIRTLLCAAHSDLESLSLPHLPQAIRVKTERSLQGRLSMAQRRMDEVKDALQAHETVHEHHLHQQLERIRTAMASAKTHVQERHAQHKHANLQETKAKAYAELREFFCRHLSGRIYADGTVIQLRSDLTGRLAEFNLDVAHASALAQLLGQPGEGLLGSLRDPSTVFSARFEARAANDKLHLHIEGGERTIQNGEVAYVPQRFVCEL